MTIALEPPAERLARVIAAIDDDQLGSPTPCADATVGDLVDHVGSLTVAFTGAARKQHDHPGAGSPPPPPSAANLEEGWRERIGRDLRTLAEAWDEPGAWEGMTKAGGGDLPAEVAGLVALDEVVVHGWDLASATGQAYEIPDEEAQVALSFVGSFDAPRDGVLFGPVVDVPDGAPPSDRLLGLTGRDPSWAPSDG